MADKQADSTKTETKAEEREAPTSVRDSIIAAVEEHASDRETEDISKDGEKSVKDDKEDATAEPEENREIESEDRAAEAEDTSERVDSQREAKGVKSEVKETKAPSILPKEIQNEWSKLPQPIQTYLTKSQKELADTKAELGRTQQRTRDMDAALAPYQQEIVQYGTTPAETVSRVMQWLRALTGPDKVNAIRQLGQGFGINLDDLYYQHYVGQQQQQDPNAQYQDPNQNPQATNYDPRIYEAFNSISQELDGLKATQQSQREAGARQHIESWAGLQPDGTFKNKPYLPQVKQVMFSLLNSGVVPLINGQLDLDTAYEQACYSVPDVRNQLLAQQESEKQAKALEARKKKEAEEKAKLAKAKSLSHSLKSSSPSANITDSNGKMRNKDTGKYISAGDSIRAAIKELQN